MRSHHFILLLFVLLGACVSPEITPELVDDTSKVSNPPSNQRFTTNNDLDLTNMPFTVQNMQKAYSSLMKNQSFLEKFSGQSISPKLQINASHYYYRFLPKNEAEQQLLEDDEVLNVSDTPFSYKDETTTFQATEYELMIEAADAFVATPFYAVVAIGHQVPNVEYEILAEFYFPPEEIGERPKSEVTTVALEAMGVEAFNDIETESMKLTNQLTMEDLNELQFNNIRTGETKQSYTELLNKGFNLVDAEVDYNVSQPSMNTGRGRRCWTPSGRITFEEDALTDLSNPNNTFGVPSALVKVRKWGFLVIKSANTNEDGSFATPGIRTRRVKYAVWFVNNRHIYKVKAGTVFWTARHRGTRTYRREAWNQHFTTGSRSHFYAMVHHAAYDYYERVVSQYGLQRPGSHTSFSWLRISAKYNKNGSQYLHFNPLSYPFLSEARVARLKKRTPNDVYRGSDGVYASTIHELTHAGHYKMDPAFFLHGVLFGPDGRAKARRIMAESWAEGVETIVTNDRYSSLDPTYFNITNNHRGHNFVRQFHSIEDMNAYTPLVIDLVDTLNQSGRGSYPRDRVSDYQLLEVQQALFLSRNLDTFRERLRALYNNPTEVFLDELFEYPLQVEENLN